MTLLHNILNSLVIGSLVAFCVCTSAKQKPVADITVADTVTIKYHDVLPGSYLFDKYLPMLKGKSVAVFANHTSVVGSSHLVDTLRKQGINIKKIFAPEHGFRGTADAGEKVASYTDKQSGIAVISLYGKKRKPTAEDVKDIDVIVFDIQDLGVRFYTYISSLQDMMEACVQLNKPLIVLDRPNPNGFYVDGPVLNLKYKSFVGMQPVPVVYGLTIGEYANLLLNEKMLTVKVPYPVTNVDNVKDANATEYGKKSNFSLTIITCGNYTHKSKYVLPVKPSPNIPDIQAIYLYPSTCFFEGTVLSEGRGTDKAFKVFGHPSLPKNLYSFTPNPTEGAKSSKLYGQVCYGWNLDGTPEQVLKKTDGRIQLKWLMEAYKLFPVKDSFFIIPKSGKMEDAFINKLTGNNDLWQQIRAGLPEDEIRKSWEPQLTEFKKTRKKYLLYEDF